MADPTSAVPTDQLLVGLAALVLVLVCWYVALRDLVRRDDLGSAAKAAWAVGIVVTGFVGSVLYFLLRPRGATESEREKLTQMSDDFVSAHAAARTASMPSDDTPPDRVIPDPVMPDMPDDAERTRGRYLYTRDGAPVGVDERFVLGAIASGAVRVRSTRITASPTARLETDVRFSTEAVSALVRWVGSDPAVVRSATAEYVDRGGVVDASWSVDGESGSDQVVGAAYPLMRVFTGPFVLRSVLGLDVVVPDIADARDAASFLRPSSSRRSAEVLGDREVLVDGVARAGTAYRWTGGAYGEDGADFVVDAGGLLLSYAVTQPSGRWEVTLAEVTGPWPVPSSWPTPG